MAMSRFRQPLFSRAPCLFAHRLLSSSFPSTSITRFSSFKALSKDENGSLPRCTPVSTITGFLGGLSKIKFGVRHMSSTEDPPHIVLEMPALSPTMSQGNIAKWKKKEGDKIGVGDVLCEIETDKAIVEYESLEDCFLAKILAPEGSKDIPVGRAIAVTVEDLDDISKVPSIGGVSEVKEGKSAPTDVRSQVKELETVAVKIDASQLPPHIVLDMPALSPTMNQGNIAKWQKKEGDKIEVGDILCEIETDKATLEYESLEEGYLAKILAPDGTKDVAVGKPIAVTVEALEDVETLKDSYTHSSVAKEEKPKSLSSKRDSKEQNSGIKRISPSAKMLISEFGLDASLLSPSGPRGTLLKGDVLAAINSGKGSFSSVATMEKSQSSRVELQSIYSSSPQPVSFEDLSNSQIRKVIASRLLESKQSTPHIYLSTDVVLDGLLSFRKELIENHNVKVSVNDIVIKAVAVALRKVSDANGFWDGEKGKVMFNDSVDISIAVATEKGLMTPIVRNADQKTISAISSEVKDLAERARAGKLKPNEFQGGTFSISNLGMYPVDHFCAIINPPQAGILAVGRGNKVVEPVSGSGTDELAVVTKMNLTLSADHRVFDGKVGGEFLKALRANFGDMKRLLL